MKTMVTIATTNDVHKARDFAKGLSSLMPKGCITDVQDANGNKYKTSVGLWSVLIDKEHYPEYFQLLLAKLMGTKHVIPNGMECSNCGNIYHKSHVAEDENGDMICESCAT